jgi:hypothetical protein
VLTDSTSPRQPNGSCDGAAAASDRRHLLVASTPTYRPSLPREMRLLQRERRGGGAREAEWRPNWDAPGGGRSRGRGALAGRRLDIGAVGRRGRQPRARAGQHPRGTRRRQWPPGLQGLTVLLSLTLLDSLIVVFVRQWDNILLVKLWVCGLK